MPYLTLCSLYYSFMESNELRHQDLIGPFRKYAKAHNMKMSDVLKQISSNYQRI